MKQNDAGIRGLATISYAGLARGRDYEHWVEEICRGLVRVDVQPLQDGEFAWAMAMTELPDVRLGTFSGSAIQFTARPGDPAPRLYLQMPRATPLRLVHGPRTMNLESDQIALADAAQTKAQTMVLACGQFDTFGVDRNGLIALCPDAEDKIVRPLAVDPSLNSLIRNYHAFAISNASTFDAQTRHMVAQHIVDLVALALGPAREAAAIVNKRGLVAARLAAIKADILDNLARTDLSVAVVAARQGVTPRYVHLLFEADGVTFSEFVVGQRLVRAHRMLSDLRFAHRSINTIALDVGFGDLSYFNRTFRRRYGLTPSDVRRRADESRS